MNLAANHDLIRLHDLLNSGADIAQSDIDTSLTHTSIGGILHGRQQIVINRIECKRECRIDDTSYGSQPGRQEKNSTFTQSYDHEAKNFASTFNMDTKIDLANVAVLKHYLVSSVGRVMCRYMVQRAAGGECNTRFETVGFHQVTSSVFDQLADLRHGHARFDSAASILADLAMHLCSSSSIVVLIKILFLQRAFFLVRRPPKIANRNGQSY